jgi:hypothetical protein
MRIKITKTLDATDLAGETRRILDQIKNRVMYGLPDQMSQIVRTSLSSQGEEYFLTIDLIDHFRQQLAAVDENLQEVYNIMKGHKNAIMPPEPEQSPEQERDAEWAANEQAEYEKFMSQTMDAEDGHEPVEDEEG